MLPATHPMGPVTLTSPSYATVSMVRSPCAVARQILAFSMDFVGLKDTIYGGEICVPYEPGLRWAV